MHHDFFIKNTTDPKYAKYLFRWEFPTIQRYKTKKTKELYEDGQGEPGYIDVVVKEPNETNQEIDYGFEYGLFECDKTERAFKIKIENDVRKLINPVNKIKNKYIMCFFRCKDFERANAVNVRKRIDSVKARSKKFSEIMFEICRNSKTDSLKAIFVEIFLINQQIKCEIRTFPIEGNDDLIKGLCKNSAREAMSLREA